MKRRDSTSRKADAARFDRDSVEPMYVQIAGHLLGAIERKELKEGARLPSESALMEQFGVSRVTVRQAIAMLRRQHKLVSQRGKGTFVSARVVAHDLDVLQGFYDSLRVQGIDTKTRLIEFSADGGATDDERPARLDLPVKLTRLYLVDDLPFAVVVGYLPRAAAGLVSACVEHLTVYQILESYLGMRVTRADVAIRCLRPPRAIAKLLRMQSSASTLVMERESFAPSGSTCEFMRIFIVPDRYEFRLHVNSPLQPQRSPLHLQKAIA